MKYYRDSWKDNAVFGRRQTNWPWRRWVLFLIFFLALIVFFSGFVFRTVERWSVGTAGTLWRGEATWSRALGGWFSFFSSQRALREENEALRREIRELASQGLANELLRRENEEWRQLFGRTSQSDLPLVAYVVSSPRTAPSDILLVDLGVENSVTPPAIGDLVVAQHNVLLGQVESVAGRTAKVKLFSWPNVSLPSVVGGSGVMTEARGLGGGNFIIEWPRGLEIEKGELVHVPLFNERWILGTVDEIQDEAANPFQNLLIKSPVNLQQLDRVEIYVF